MAATISIGSSDDAIWMIKNALYEDLVNLACMHYGDDTDVVKELKQSVFVNGIALEIIKDTELAMRETDGDGSTKLLNEEGHFYRFGQ